MKAFAPGSVTALFAPASTIGNGTSSGASFATAAGVSVDVTQSPKTEITVEGESAAFEPIKLLLDDFDVTAKVDVSAAIPLGHGFGASGAATLATALAVNAVYGHDRERDKLVQAAHRAELRAGTGQGDVYIQDRGGLLWSAGRDINRVEVNHGIEYTTAGGIDTRGMLADDAFMERARQVGTRLLHALETPPTLRDLAEHGRVFIDETGIATPFVERELQRVDHAGGVGSMALFGNTVFAVDVTGVLPNSTTVSNVGARLLPDDGDFLG